MKRNLTLIFLAIFLGFNSCEQKKSEIAITDQGRTESFSNQIKSKGLILKQLSFYIANKTPVIFNRPNLKTPDDSINAVICNYLKTISISSVKTNDFREFSIVFLLNCYYIDILCCNQGYDLYDQLDYPYNLVLEFFFYENGLKKNNFEIFCSGQVLCYHEYIMKNMTANIQILLNKINSLENQRKLDNFADKIN